MSRPRPTAAGGEAGKQLLTTQWPPDDAGPSLGDVMPTQELVAGTTRASLKPRIELVAQIHELVDCLASRLADDVALQTAAELVDAATRAVATGAPQPGYVRAVDGVLSGLFPVSELGPFTSALHVTAPPFTITVHDDEGQSRVTAETTYGSAFEGPLGCVQGGFLAAAFDEILGLAQSGWRRVTVRLELEYHAPAMLHVPVRYSSWIQKVEGRKAYVVGQLHQQGQLCATASALFVQPRVRAQEPTQCVRVNGPARGPCRTLDLESDRDDNEASGESVDVANL